MGVSRSVLIEEARKILQIPFRELGYEFDPSNPDGWGQFRFEKKLRRPVTMFYVVEFQPDGFHQDDDFFDMAVNLYRSTSRKRDRLGKRIEGGPEQIWSLRLNSHIWRGVPLESMDGTWWHFLSVEEVRVAYEDILKKYGIPFLEDPKSTFSSGMGLSEV